FIRSKHRRAFEGKIDRIIVAACHEPQSSFLKKRDRFLALTSPKKVQSLQKVLVRVPILSIKPDDMILKFLPRWCLKQPWDVTLGLRVRLKSQKLQEDSSQTDSYTTLVNCSN